MRLLNCSLVLKANIRYRNFQIPRNIISFLTQISPRKLPDCCYQESSQELIFCFQHYILLQDFVIHLCMSREKFLLFHDTLKAFSCALERFVIIFLCQEFYRILFYFILLFRIIKLSFCINMSTLNPMHCRILCAFSHA